MNERIKELKQRTTDSVDSIDDGFGIEEYRELIDQKFAELIAEDCADLFEIEYGASLISGDDVARLLKQRFNNQPPTSQSTFASSAQAHDRWCPDICPITGQPFFMWIEHHATGQMVPTYGGPYDSYTIPVREGDGSYCRERYDHDNGWWVTDEVEDVGIQIVSDQACICDDECPKQAAPAIQESVVNDAARYRWLRDGKGLTVVVPTPTEDKLGKKITIIYSPSPYGQYGAALDVAIDAMIAAAPEKGGEA